MVKLRTRAGWGGKKQTIGAAGKKEEAKTNCVLRGYPHPRQIPDRSKTHPQCCESAQRVQTVQLENSARCTTNNCDHRNSHANDRPPTSTFVNAKKYAPGAMQISDRSQTEPQRPLIAATGPHHATRKLGQHAPVKLWSPDRPLQQSTNDANMCRNKTTKKSGATQTPHRSQTSLNQETPVSQKKNPG